MNIPVIREAIDNPHDLKIVYRIVEIIIERVK